MTQTGDMIASYRFKNNFFLFTSEGFRTLVLSLIISSEEEYSNVITKLDS